MIPLPFRRAAALAALLLLPGLLIAQEAPDTSAMTPLQKLILKAKQQAGQTEPEPPDSFVLPEGMTRLTVSSGDEGECVWAPDGGSLYYEVRSKDGRRIFKLNLADGSREAVSDSTESCFNPAISPDGKFLAFVRNLPELTHKLWIMRLEDGEIAKLTEDGGKRSELSPAWSHNGGTLYFSLHEMGSSNTWPVSISREGDNLEMLAEGLGSWQRPAPSPSGKQIAWVLRLGQSSGLRIMDSRVSALVESFDFPGYFLGAASWLPGERELVVSYLDLSAPREGYNLGIVDLETGLLTPWIDMDDATGPAVSPDGGQVAFRAKVNGKFELFLAPSP